MFKWRAGIALIVLAAITLIIKTGMFDKETTEPTDTVAAGYEETKKANVSGLEIGKVPPDFELATLSGGLVKLSDYKGKKIILNFWASWCGPCKVEMPHMQNYYNQNKDAENVEIIAVNMTSEERGGQRGIKKFVSEYGLTFPILLDHNGKVMDLYKIIAIPTTFVIGTDGVINEIILGPMDEEMIKDLIGNLK